MRSGRRRPWPLAVTAPPYDVVTRERGGAARRRQPAELPPRRPVRDRPPPDTDPHAPASTRGPARASTASSPTARSSASSGRPSTCTARRRRARAGRPGRGVHVDDYERGVIRKHETTRPDKEDDRTRHALALGAHAEPVLLLYRDRAEIDRLAGREVERAPLLDVAAADGVRHTMWRSPSRRPGWSAFGRGRARLRGRRPSSLGERLARGAPAPERGSRTRRGDEEHNWFMAVLFPASQLRILPYHRLVRDLGGRTPARDPGAAGSGGRLSVTDTPVPPGRGAFCLYLERRWYRLGLAPHVDRPRRPGPLTRRVRSCRSACSGRSSASTTRARIQRIDFVGGIRGTGELERRVDARRGGAAPSRCTRPRSSS